MEDRKQEGVSLFPWEVLMSLIIMFSYVDITANIPMGILHSRSLSVNQFWIWTEMHFQETQSYRGLWFPGPHTHANLIHNLHSYIRTDGIIILYSAYWAYNIGTVPSASYILLA